MEHLFDCAICERDIKDFDSRFRKGRDRQLAPICRTCEQTYGDRAPVAGSFMDRRIAVQISALAHALHNKASLIDWSVRHGRA